jgi:hypothetical protein
MFDDNVAGTTKAHNGLPHPAGQLPASLSLTRADINKITRCRLMYGRAELIVLGTVFNGSANQLNYIDASEVKHGLQLTPGIPID